jgi:hypothetical protein
VNTDTTLKELTDAWACPGRYRHLCEALGGATAYGRTTPIPVLTILEHNGMADAEWALAKCPSLKPLYDDYLAKRKLLDDDCEAKRKLLDDDYRAKRKLLDDGYRAKRKPLLNELCKLARENRQ